MKIDVKKKIENYFSGSKLDSKATKKTKKLAMSIRLRLKDDRKKFCKKCYSDIRNGKVKLNNKNKVILCGSCGFLNRWRIK